MAETVDPDERWKRLEGLFDEGRRVPASERDAFLAQACGDDVPLRAELLRLLAASDAPGLQPPTAGEVDRWLGGEAADRAGQRLGDCTLRRRVAAGGMGVVYEAWQEPPGRAVAVKLLRSAFADAGETARFAREARALAAVDHPGVCRVFETGTWTDAHGESLPYLVLEFVPGAETIVAAANRRSLGREARVELLAQTSDAVQASHQRGVIHRDLKPGNVLVGSDGRPRVIDFGIARTEDTETLTRPGQVMGTMAYLPPERLAGGGDDVRGDVFGLGAILFELLSGRPPREVAGLSFTEAARVVVDAPTPRLDPFGIDRDLATVVEKALDREPARRYPTAAAFGDDLRRWLAHEPVEARPPGAWHVLSLWARRRRAAAIALAVTALVVLGGTAAVLAFAASEASARRAAERQRARAERLLAETTEFVPWVLRDVRTALETLPGAAGPKAMLTDGVRRHLDALEPSEGDDPRVVAAISDAYRLLAEDQGGFSGANLGNRQGAEEDLRKSLQAAESLLARSPGDLRALRAKAAAHVVLAQHHRYARADSTRALAEVERADVAVKAMLRAAPTDVEALRLAAATDHLRAMSAAPGTSPLPLFETALASALAYAGAVSEGHAGEREVLRTRSERLGAFAAAGLAEEAAREAAAMTDLLTGPLGASSDARDRAAVVSGWLAIAESRPSASDPKGRGEALDRGLAALEVWRTADPVDVRARAQSAIFHEKRGLLRMRTGDGPGVSEDLEAAVALQRGLVLADPADPTWSWNLRATLHSHGLGHRGAQRFEEAIAAFDESIQITRDWLAKRPDFPLALFALAASLRQSAMALVQLAEREGSNAARARPRLEEAKRRFEETLALYARIGNRQPHLPVEATKAGLEDVERRLAELGNGRR